MPSRASVWLGIRHRQACVFRWRGSLGGGNENVNDLEESTASWRAHVRTRRPRSHSTFQMKRRGRLLITNGSIPRQTRSLIRYALETKDPRLADLVRRAEQRMKD